MANILPSDIFHEPSAGTGGIAAWAKAAGASVHVNEIDPFRRALVDWAIRGAAPATGVDAEYLNALLPPDIKPTVVVMNPPFSATGGRLKNNKNEFGYKHVMEALKRLQPGGRLVAILGEGARMDAPNAKDFWQSIAKIATLRANVGISGKEYAKYGTTFGNRLIVIDKAPLEAGVTAAPITGDFENIESAYDALKSIAERPTVVERPSGPAVAPIAGPIHGLPGAESGVSAPGSGQSGTPATGKPPASVPAGRPGKGAAPSKGQKPGPEIKPVIQPVAAPGGSNAGDGGELGVTLPAPEEDRLSLEQQKQEELQTSTEDDSSYVTYVPTIQGRAHPGSLVETKVMASVQAPPITYRPNLPEAVMAKAPKPLSAAQMETVARAGMMFQSFSDTGHRNGFLLGDGTGVGKGQQLASIIWDRYRSGYKRAIWVSASKALHQDARRDFLGIGATELADKLFSINDYNAAVDIDAPEGVMFSTYSSLIAKAKGDKGQTRLDQIKKWLGEEGVIIFDEAHKAKNAVAAAGARGLPSKTGESVLKIQDDLPRAFVTYASATSATDVANLGYLTRMSFCGEGTQFDVVFGHFMAEVGRGGVAAMELISRELKAMGRYISRSISYKGVSFEEKTHDLTDDQRRVYDAAADAWQQAYQMSMQQLKDNGGDSRARGNFSMAYWGAQQFFYRKLLTAMKLPTLMDLTDKALAEGKSVVISLIGTGAAQADRALAGMREGGDDEDDLDFSPKASLIKMIQDNYPVTLYEEYTDENGKTRTRSVVRDGKTVTNPDAEAKRDELIKSSTRNCSCPTTRWTRSSASTAATRLQSSLAERKPLNATSRVSGNP